MINRFLQPLNIVEPTLLLDERRVRRNIERMVNKARSAGVRLRPHAKTHQSAEIGGWFREYGIDTITVSSLNMAAYFAAHHWQDITVAFPVNILEIEKINRLAGRIRLDLMVDAGEVVSFLDRHLEAPVGIWIKVDVGYGRAGLSWQEASKIVSLARTVAHAPKMEFRGLLTHAGHTYKARSPAEVDRINRESRDRLIVLKEEILKSGMAGCLLSVGDTPGCSIGEDFSGIDEIRPGNFVFYDLYQYGLGSCRDRDMAAAVACPVVGTYPDRRQIVIYGGGIHLSIERMPDKQGHALYGYLAFEEDGTWGPPETRAPVVALSQEHGIVKMDEKIFERIHIGDTVVVLPVHVCLTVHLYPAYTSLGGRIIGKMTES
jgi:D-serine deaminase-like pyridoxal phosphate-dependent protein